MTQNTLYLLLYADHPPQDPQDNSPKHQPDYWLDYIADLGKGSSVILLKNLFQKGENKRISTQGHDVLEKYEEKGLLQFGTPQVINAQVQDDNKRKVLVHEIMARAETLIQQASQLPESWVEMRKHLGKLSANKISYATYVKIGETYGLKPQELETVLLYLHHAGDVFYQKDTFNNQIILDLDWAIRAVYTILKAPQIKAKHKGEDYQKQYFTLADLQQLFPDKKKAEVELYLSFMESCQLVFKKRGVYSVESQYLAPRLLPPSCPKINFNLWSKFQSKVSKECTYLRIHYPFLHFSIIEQFIVQVASRLPTCVCWQNGLLIIDDSGKQGDALVQVKALNAESTTKDQYLEITTYGPNKEMLLANIRQTFKNIRHFSEAVQEELSLDGERWASKVKLEKDQQPLRYEDDSPIDQAAFKNLLTAFKQVTNRQEDGGWLTSLAEVSRHQRAGQTPPKKKIFIAYAEKDKAHLDRFKQELTILSHHLDFTIWDNSQILAGDEREKSITTALEAADLAFFLVSSDFLALQLSKASIQTAIQRNLEESDPFRMIPIIIRACNWKISPLGSLQVLPKDEAKQAISKWGDSDEFWLTIAETVEELL